MIRYLRLKNFRAFKEQDFRFKRLNVFIGKNNSGKSSAISALNVLAQTVLSQEFEGSPLVLNGPFDQLGTYIDVVHGNLSRRKMEIEIHVNDSSILTEFKYRGQRREIEVTAFELKVKGKQYFKYSTGKDSYNVFLKGQRFETLFPNIKKRRPRFRRAVASTGGMMNVSMRVEHRNTPAMSTYTQVNSALIKARSDLTDHFEQFDSISPFRDRPSRTYLYSGESARRIGITGSNTAAMLAADASRRGAQRKDLEEKVSSWFQYTGIAKGIKVESLTPRHFEICLISNDNTKHNICDVGFGCSQVLPVLVSGLSLFSGGADVTDSRMLVVQEPEIHLHPDAQAALGSYFASLVDQGGQVFIETHSDNLVLRIARHVALGDLNPADVAIFFVSDEAEKRVTEIKITESGTFDPDWPNGFFPQRQTESLLLARAAMARRKESPQKELEFKYPATRV